MKQKTINRIVSLLLVLVCVLGVLPLSAFAAEQASAPGSITQKSSDYMKINGKSVRYKAASSAINNVGLPYVFNEQVTVPGYGDVRALCAYQKGTLGPAANGQRWNYKEEVNSASLPYLRRLHRRRERRCPGIMDPVLVRYLVPGGPGGELAL